MAKKTIISDFSALKGKVTFSEGAPVAQVAKPRENKPVVKSEGGLKVGMKVVLMDSDLRGTIVSLGKTVGIKQMSEHIRFPFYRSLKTG